jgi:sec-independent protein translocase protein TatA
MPSIGPAEVLVILVIALLVFGPQKLPEIGKQVGRAMREFRKAQNVVRSELRDAFDITGGSVTGTNAAPPTYGNKTAPASSAPAGPAATSPPAPTPEPGPSGTAAAITTPASGGVGATNNGAVDADDDPARGRRVGASSRPTAAPRAGLDPAADPETDPAFGRRAGAPVEPH